MLGSRFAAVDANTGHGIAHVGGGAIDRSRSGIRQIPSPGSVARERCFDVADFGYRFNLQDLSLDLGARRPARDQHVHEWR
jgi:hypothetical protein